MANVYRAYDGRYGLGTTLALTAIAIVGAWAAFSGTKWWGILALLTVPFVGYRLSRIHSSPERRFYHHFLMLFSGNLGAEVSRAKHEGREPMASTAALAAVATLLPNESSGSLLVLMARSLAELDNSDDRDRLASTILAKTKTPTNSVEACRRALDEYIDKNRRSCTARWIAAHAVETQWGAAARLNLLSDIVLARLTENY